MSHGPERFFCRGMRRLRLIAGLEGVDISNDAGGCQGVEVLGWWLEPLVAGRGVAKEWEDEGTRG